MLAQLFLALGSGLAVGLLFAWPRLPLPAPPSLVGIAGALGVCLGGLAYHRFFG